MNATATALLGTTFALVAIACAILSAVVAESLALRVVLIAITAIALLGAGAMIGATVTRLRAAAADEG